jgi:hypothetical protein
MRQDWLPLGGNFRHNWHSDGEHRARTVAPVAGNDPPAQGFDKAAADREAKPSAGMSAILRVDAVESVEDAFEIGRRYSRALVDDFDLDELSIAGRPNEPLRIGPPSGISSRIAHKSSGSIKEDHAAKVRTSRKNPFSFFSSVPVTVAEIGGAGPINFCCSLE